MNGKLLSPWRVPVVALVQVYFATALASPLREPGAPWNGGYAVLSAAATLCGFAILAFAVRNCLRLWRVQPRDATWALIAATGAVTVFSVLWALGPTTIGVWHWSSVIPGTFAAYLIVVLSRVGHARVAHTREPYQDVEPQNSKR